MTWPPVQQGARTDSSTSTPNAHAADHTTLDTAIADIVARIIADEASFQPLDSDLTAIAALTTSSFGRSFLTLADAAAARTLIGASTAPVIFASSGVQVTGTGTLRYYPPAAATISAVRASVGTSPTGSSLICDVRKNGTTIFTTTGNRPTITASANTGLSGTPDVTALTTTDYLTVDVTQIGSTVAGSDLTVSIFF